MTCLISREQLVLIRRDFFAYCLHARRWHGGVGDTTERPVKTLPDIRPRPAEAWQRWYETNVSDLYYVCHCFQLQPNHGVYSHNSIFVHFFQSSLISPSVSLWEQLEKMGGLAAECPASQVRIVLFSARVSAIMSTDWICKPDLNLVEWANIGVKGYDDLSTCKCHPPLDSSSTEDQNDDFSMLSRYIGASRVSQSWYVLQSQTDLTQTSSNEVLRKRRL